VLLRRPPYQQCHPGGVDVNVDPLVRDAPEVIDGVGVPGCEAGDWGAHLDPPLVPLVDHRLTDPAVDQPAEARSAVAGEARKAAGAASPIRMWSG
jgi:hypothetical protein